MKGGLHIISSPKQLYLLLLAPVIVDLLIGISMVLEINFSIGKGYRGLLYLLGVILLIKNNKINFWVIFNVLWFFFFFIWILHSDNFSFLREITFFFKATYVFAILELINGVKMDILDKKYHLHFILKKYAQIVATCILISFFTGIGLETYGEWAFGASSFFVGANDIGVSQLLVFTLLLFNKKTVEIGWVWLAIIFSSLILLGTTTGMFGSIGILGVFIFGRLVLTKLTSVTNLFLRLSAIIISGAVIIVSLLILINYIKNSDYYSEKYSKVLKEGVRSRLTNAGEAYFEKRGTFINVLGEGFSSYTTNFGKYSAEIKHSKNIFTDWLLVETDYHDFIGAFGIILTLVLFSFYFYYFIISGINFYNSQTIYSFSLFLALTMALGHGYIAGHVFYSPTVMGIMAIVLKLIMQQTKRT